MYEVLAIIFVSCVFLSLVQSFRLHNFMVSREPLKRQLDQAFNDISEWAEKYHEAEEKYQDLLDKKISENYNLKSPDALFSLYADEKEIVVCGRGEIFKEDIHNNNWQESSRVVNQTISDVIFNYYMNK